MTSESLFAEPIKRWLLTVEELIERVESYGMTEIPADLLACLEDIATDLAVDDGTRQRRSAFPYTYRSTRLAG
jgi:hypothetical protein